MRKEERTDGGMPHRNAVEFILGDVFRVGFSFILEEYVLTLCFRVC